MMHGHGKSDSSIVRTKPPNEAEPEAKEAVDGRGLAKGNLLKRNMSRTQGRPGMPGALERIRQPARRDKRQRFTALLHHVYDVERLRAAYFALRREAAPGIDGETWRHYGEKLQRNLEDLSERLKRGAYRAKPVRRAYIAKVGKPGELRPLGVAVLKDKIVQRATVEVFNALYEEDFVGFSYGFRANRSPHHALDALTLGIMRSKVNWVLDCDIRAFFDTLEHGWLVKFIEHRVADRRVVRLIQKWLKAGVVEEGKRMQSEIGTVQAEASVRFWPTSISTMYSISGFSNGGEAKRVEMWLWCGLRMTSWLDSSEGRTGSGCGVSLGNGWADLDWNFTRRKRA